MRWGRSTSILRISSAACLFIWVEACTISSLVVEPSIEETLQHHGTRSITTTSYGRFRIKYADEIEIRFPGSCPYAFPNSKNHILPPSLPAPSMPFSGLIVGQEQFVDFYYKAFDTDPGSLASLYV